MAKQDRYRAALFWRMTQHLPALRRLLSSEEKESLNDHYQEYKKEDSRMRKDVTGRLQQFLDQKRPVYPALAGIGGMILWMILLIYHGLEYPEKKLLRFYIFQPLLLAALAPFSIYLLSNLERKLYFRLDLRPSSLLHSILAFTALTMLLASINQDGLPRGPSMDGFHLTLWICGIAVAPLFEEIAFRQWLPSRFGQDPHWLGHAISATVFTAAHIPTTLDPELALYYWLSGITLSALRIQTDSLLWTFLVHAVANVAIALAM
ncbi:MAG: type II CAAX endopeptidase family protein [Leptospiraceae bacterium]